MTRQTITLTLLLFLLGASLIFVAQTIQSTSISTGNSVSIVSALVMLGLLVAHVRRWRWSSEATLVLVIVLIGVGAAPNFVRDQTVVASLVPAVVASLLFPPRWTPIAFVATLLAIALRVVLTAENLSLDSFGPTFGVLGLVQLGLIVAGMTLGSSLARSNQRAAEQSALAANTAREHAEEQSRELAAQVSVANAARAEAEAANEAVAQQLKTIEQQREALREMSVPILPVTSSSLLMPLVGALDTSRLHIVQEQALAAIQHSRARHLILDVTGVPVVDTQVAQGLVQVVRASRLLGASVVLVGIRPEVAQALVGLGITLEGIATHQSLREGMASVIAAGR